MKEKIIYGKNGPEYMILYGPTGATVFHLRDGVIGTVTSSGVALDKHGRFLGWNDDVDEGVGLVIANYAAKKAGKYYDD
uniref:Uncharacterized protein n=1 Tax=candidate division WOR-3 bacterium TaxID=2052148 RepID=A0A7V4E3X3_UNCW3